MRYYEVYISMSREEKIHTVILGTKEPLETLELWARTIANKYFPNFNIVDAEYNYQSFFFYNENFRFIHVMFIERDCYHV